MTPSGGTRKGRERPRGASARRERPSDRSRRERDPAGAERVASTLSDLGRRELRSPPRWHLVDRLHASNFGPVGSAGLKVGQGAVVSTTSGATSVPLHIRRDGVVTGDGCVERDGERGEL